MNISLAFRLEFNRRDVLSADCLRSIFRRIPSPLEHQIPLALQPFFAGYTQFQPYTLNSKHSPDTLRGIQRKRFWSGV